MSTQSFFLPSPRSYLTLSSLPSLSSSILSPPLPTSLSTPSFQSHHDLEQQSQHHRPFNPLDPTNPSSPPRALPFAAQNLEDDGDSFLLHTASALVNSALEQKGHSWLAARKSSTSLTLSSPTSPTVSRREYFSPSTVHSRAYSPRSSAINTPRAACSRHHSRRPSASKSVPTIYPTADFVERESMLQQEPNFDLNDFRNERAVAMNAESEVQNLLRARVGGWLEWVVGWMDFRDDNDDDNDYEVNEKHLNIGLNGRESTPMKVEIKPIKNSVESKLDNRDRNGDEIQSGNKGISLPAPTYPQVSFPVEIGTETGAELGAEARAANLAGVHDIWWGDAKWLLGVAGKLAW